MPSLKSVLRLAAVAGMAACSAFADDWLNLATISMTDAVTPKLSNRYVCYTDGRDIRCDSPSLYVTTGGLVGIGTTNPQTALEVNGTVSATNFVGDGSGLTNLSVSGDRIVSGTLAAIANSGGYISLTTGGTTWGYFGSGGSYLPTVGIGSGQFDSILTVSGTDLASFTGTTALQPLTLKGGGTLGNWRGIDFRTYGSWPIGRIGLQFASGGTYMGFGTSNNYSNGITNQALTIDPQGRLGVNNVLPTATLQVSGSFVVSVTGQNTTPTLNVGSNGNVAIGTALSGNKLTVGGAIMISGGSPLTTDVNNDLRLQSQAATIWNIADYHVWLNKTSAREYMRVSNAGNIGISTSTPLAKLDVNGTISASDAIQVGQSNLSCTSGVSGSIRYNTTSGTIQVCNGTGWVSLSSGTSAGVSSLAALTDINITNLAGRDYLRYDAGTSKWVNISESSVMSTTTMLSGFPDAIECASNTSDRIILHFSHRDTSSGLVTYRYIWNGNTTVYSVVFGSNGNYSTHTNLGAYDCVTASKSISTLYAEGKAFNFIGSANASNTTALGDRITSGTLAMVANSATSYISLSTGSTTWGYLNSGASYLPGLDVGNVGRIMSANISAASSGKALELRFISNTDRAYITSYDRGGSAYKPLSTDSSYFSVDITGVEKFRVSANGISASDAIQVSGSSLTCGSGLKGAMRYSNTSSTIEYCQGTAWVSMGPSATEGPIFSVTKSGNQTVTASTETLLTWETEKQDTHAAFATNKFQPSVAGFYIINLQAACNDGTRCYGYISKNSLNLFQSTGFPVASVSGVVYLNGSTDYVQGKVYNMGGTIVLGTPYSNFSGALIGGAVGGGGSAMPAGSSNDVQYNSSGALAADTGNFTYASGLLSAPAISAANISASGVVQVSGSSLTCAAGLKGAMRYSNTSSTIEYCQGTAWVSMGPSATDVPAFRVTKSTNQTVTSGVDAVLTWDTEIYDTYNNFASNKFTPTVAGYYLVTAAADCVGSTNCWVNVRKNGSGVLSNFQMYGSANYIDVLSTGIVYLNGTTDYVDATVRNSPGTSINSDATRTYFTGILIASGNGLAGGGGGATPAGSSNDVQYNSSGALAADTGNFTYASGLLTAPTIGTGGLTVTGQVSASFISSTVVQVSGSSLTCNSGLKGAIRYSNTSGTIEYCQGSAWMNVAAADAGVYASYYSNAAQSIPNNAFTTVTAFGNKKFDSGSAFNGTTFTAPVAGVYSFHAQTGFVNIAGGTIIGSRFLKNGATVFGYKSTRSTNTAADVNVGSDALIQLAANDTVVFQAWQATGSAQNTRNDTSSFFDVYGPVDANAGSGGGGGATPAGGAGDIQFNDGSNLAADTGQLFWDATNNRLGIGTSAPGAALTVSASEGLRLQSTGPVQNPYISWWNGSTRQAYMGWNASGVGFDLQMENNNAFVINSSQTAVNGKLAIGKYPAVANLDVVGTISASDAIQVSGSSLTCAAGLKGAIRYSNTSNTLEYCNSQSWASLGPSPTALPYLRLTYSGSLARSNVVPFSAAESGGGASWSSNKFTAAVPGVYLLTVGGDSVGTFNHSVSIRKNGSDMVVPWSANSSTTKSGTAAAAVVAFLNVGDYIDFYFYHDDGAKTLTSGFASIAYISSGASSSGSAVGSTGDIQYNNGGTLAADTGQLTWDATNNRLGVGTASPAESIDAGGGNVKMGWEMITNNCGSVSANNNCVATCSAGKYATGGACNMGGGSWTNWYSIPGYNAYGCVNNAATKMATTVYCANIR